jgi:hypothetical protein
MYDGPRVVEMNMVMEQEIVPRYLNDDDIRIMGGEIVEECNNSILSRLSDVATENIGQINEMVMEERPMRA